MTATPLQRGTSFTPRMVTVTERDHNEVTVELQAQGLEAFTSPQFALTVSSLLCQGAEKFQEEESQVRELALDTPINLGNLYADILCEVTLHLTEEGSMLATAVFGGIADPTTRLEDSLAHASHLLLELCRNFREEGYQEASS